MSLQGTCTSTGLVLSCPLTPGNGNLIIKRSTQKKSFDSSPSGKNLNVAELPSGLFQNG